MMGHAKFSAQMDKMLKTNKEHCYFSAISFWEIGMLQGKKRLHLPVTIKQFFADLVKKRSYKTLAITPEVGDLTRQFAQVINGDPADRIIVATAIANDAILLTKDANLSRLSFVETLDL